MGRPSSYTPELGTEICKRISSGRSLRAVCRDEDMPHKATVLRWARDNEVFRDQYTRAREDLLEHWADEIVEISDDGTNDLIEVENQDGTKYEKVDQEHINRSRLRVDTRKWLLSKLAPKKYGDRLTHDGEVTVGLSERMRQLSERSTDK